MPPYRRRVLPCAVLVTLLGFLPGAVSLAAAQAPAEAAPFKLSDLGLKGYAVYKNFSHFRETPFDNRNFRNEGVLQLEWDRKLAEWARLKLVGEARELSLIHI